MDIYDMDKNAIVITLDGYISSWSPSGSVILLQYLEYVGGLYCGTPVAAKMVRSFSVFQFIY